ncbi:MULTISPECIES: ComF family protein [unclassified Sphingomonas]|nr:ComF family protein [Sphingomonas sp.]
MAMIVKRWAGATVALALPPRCPGCATPVEEDHRFCADCWSGLRLIGPPWCAGCNRPFAHDRGPDARCAACIAAPPRHAGVRAAVGYGPVARALALRLKYGGRIGIAATMATRMTAVVPAGIDLLVPVPLHRWRLWTRGYNQAALIAAALAARIDVPHDPMTLVRRRATPALRDLGPRERARTVAGAFAVTETARVADRTIGLVDDVYTSGATSEACTRTLLAAGARSVVVLCWARVLPDTDV